MPDWTERIAHAPPEPVERIATPRAGILTVAALRVKMHPWKNVASATNKVEKDISDFFVAPILALLFSGIAYLWALTTRRGKPLTRLQRWMIFYATAFVLGAAYAILFQDGLGALLHWRESWIGAILFVGCVPGNRCVASSPRATYRRAIFEPTWLGAAEEVKVLQARIFGRRSKYSRVLIAPGRP